MDLLERSGELATLDRLLAECAAGGRVALVSGEAGAGKSSLARLVPFLVNRDLNAYLRHVLGHRARIALIRGDWQAARDDVDQALSDPLLGAGQVAAVAVRAVLRGRLGEPGASEDADQAAERGYRTGEVQFVGPAAIARAELHWLDGDLVRAEALSGGDADAAAEALRIYDRMGAVRPARRLRAELRARRLPVPRGPRPATVADPTGLTGRQQEVLVLLAEGLSNADIAARLTVSAKTVDDHVSAVLSKLGVSSRGRATAAARDRGP